MKLISAKSNNTTLRKVSNHHFWVMIDQFWSFLRKGFLFIKIWQSETTSQESLTKINKNQENLWTNRWMEERKEREDGQSLIDRTLPLMKTCPKT